MCARILIVNGNKREATERVVALGGRPYGEGYAEALRYFAPELECTILNAADGERLQAGISLSDFDGAVWTGSALSAYWDEPAVSRQIELARAVLVAGLPCFGSCWGLQLVCTALGGEVRANPNGIEIGIARRIRVTDAGDGHAIFAGKMPVFDALAIHRDEVVALPSGAVVLARNEVSKIQAIEISTGNSIFWGVQYHPEFDFETISILLNREADFLIVEGYVGKKTDLNQITNDFRSLHLEPGRKDLAWRYGLDDAVLDPSMRMREIGNWLKKFVLRPMLQ